MATALKSYDTEVMPLEYYGVDETELDRLVTHSELAEARLKELEAEQAEELEEQSWSPRYNHDNDQYDTQGLRELKTKRYAFVAAMQNHAATRLTLSERYGIGGDLLQDSSQPVSFLSPKQVEALVGEGQVDMANLQWLGNVWMGGIDASKRQVGLGNFGLVYGQQDAVAALDQFFEGAEEEHDAKVAKRLGMTALKFRDTQEAQLDPVYTLPEEQAPKVSPQDAQDLLGINDGSSNMLHALTASGVFPRPGYLMPENPVRMHATNLINGESRQVLARLRAKADELEREQLQARLEWDEWSRRQRDVSELGVPLRTEYVAIVPRERELTVARPVSGALRIQETAIGLSAPSPAIPDDEFSPRVPDEYDGDVSTNEDADEDSTPTHPRGISVPDDSAVIALSRAADLDDTPYTPPTPARLSRVRRIWALLNR